MVLQFYSYLTYYVNGFKFGSSLARLIFDLCGETYCRVFLDYMPKDEHSRKINLLKVVFRISLFRCIHVPEPEFYSSRDELHI